VAALPSMTPEDASRGHVKPGGCRFLELSAEELWGIEDSLFLSVVKQKSAPELALADWW